MRLLSTIEEYPYAMARRGASLSQRVVHSFSFGIGGMFPPSLTPSAQQVSFYVHLTVSEECYVPVYVVHRLRSPDPRKRGRAGHLPATPSPQSSVPTTMHHHTTMPETNRADLIGIIEKLNGANNAHAARDPK